MGCAAAPGSDGGDVTHRGTRRAVAAGGFYPGDPETLASTVDELLADAATGDGGSPAAVVVPHAGYVYSGPVAASAFRLLRGAAVERVVLLGPAHFVPLGGFAVPGASAWETPLGEVAIDAELRATASASGAAVDDLPHEPEHSLEVQLPFLQRVLPSGFRVLPVAVGRCEPGEAAGLIDALRASALVVVSTDLSHYRDDAAAKRLDRRTADAIVARDADAIGPLDACGVFALRGAVEWARLRGLDVRLLDLRTSADTSGDPGRVVGYGAFAIG